ncbi:MAG: AsmA protein [Mesorhizobium sp. SCN 65-20]|nr:MAG: AsmA protein [Mesorhizobium sp. SCN 65-20]
MLARLFVIVGGLFVLVLFAALVGPYFIQWSGYKADFEREASAILGRQVTVQGDVTARILPFPSVTFSDVIVGDADKPAMTVETFSMDAELAPLLSGEFFIFDMRLVRPKAFIDVAADGTVDWTMRPSAPFNVRQIAIEKLTVTDGQVTVRQAAGGRDLVLSEIDAAVSARSLTGPWRAEGKLRVDGVPTQLTASTGAVDPDGRMRLRLRATPANYGFVMESDGNVSAKEGRVLYAGDFSLAAAEPETKPAGDSVVAKAEKPVEPGFRLKGRFALDHAKLDVEEFRFETGPLQDPYTADGTARIDLGADPRFSITANGAQVRFDEAVGGEEAGAALSVSQRLTALERVLIELPRPTIPGKVEVDLPAIVAGDTTVRDVRLSAEPGAQGWQLNSVAATLPGRTRLEADGFLRTDGALGFDGQLLLAVGQPSGFAAWVAKDVDDAVRRLPAAGFKARVALTREQQRFDDVELILGKAKFKGELDSLQPGDARASVTMKLDGGDLDLEGLRAFAALFVTDAGANRFADTDLDLVVKAGPVSLAGLSADTVDTALRLREGVLEIDRFSVGGLAGASLSATGRIKDFPAAPTGNLDASLVAVDLAPLVNTLAAQWPNNRLVAGLAARASAYPGLLADARVDLLASAVENGDGSAGVTLSARGNAGDSDFLASLSAPAYQGAAETTQVKLEVNARNQDATTLLALAGVPALPLGVVGPGELELKAAGVAEGGLEVTAALKGEDGSADFSGVVALRQEGASLRGRTSVRAEDIEPWLMTAGVSLPGMGMGSRVDLSADVDYDGGPVAFSRLDGTINSDSVVGELKFELIEGMPHFGGSLTLDEFDLAPFAEMLLGANALSGGEGDAWSNTPFAQKSAAPFGADLEIVASRLNAEPLATASDALLKLKLDRQSMRVSDLGAKVYGGKLDGQFELKNDGGTALVTGQLRLEGADVLTIPAAGGLGGKGDFSASLSASGKSVGGLVASLSGSGTAVVEGLELPGLNPDAFAPLIVQADAIGRDINAAKVADFAPGIAGEGRFTAGRAEVAFTVAGGILRAPPLTLKDGGATVTADLKADLNSGLVAANGSIAYAPGDEEVAGSEPMLRFALEGEPGATARVFDSEPMAQFLTQRALEKEQARVEAMQAVLLEKQRLRREARYFAALQAERERIAEEARLAEEARTRAEQEAKAREEEARRQAEEEARAKAEADAHAAEDARRAEEESAAERARLAEQEKARSEAEAPPAPAVEVERAPLPEVRPFEVEPPTQSAPLPAAPVEKKLDPFRIEDFFKSLQSR